MIFYFTATGNSKHIADRIAVATDERIINIADCMKNNQVSFSLEDDETLGFVMPDYYYGIPIIVEEFMRQLNITANNDYYSYAVISCGGSPGSPERQLHRAYKLDAIFVIATVGNYVPMYKIVSDTEIKELLDKAEQETDNVIKKIKSNYKGSYNPAGNLFTDLITPIVYLIYKNGRKTHKFNTNEKCTGCGLCEQICPRNVIELENKKPVWKTAQCEECLGCLHRCPTAAINYGKKTAVNGRYINPRVKF